MNDINKRVEPFAPAVVITGATQGIGKALAVEFARGGHALVLVARDEAKLAATARALAQTHDVDVKYVACDLATEEGCADVEGALRRFGFYADILVNNAAIMTAGFFQDEDPATLRRLVDLDVRAVVDLTRRFLPGMIARRAGVILNVASRAAIDRPGGLSAYVAAKAAVVALTETMQKEVAGSGVRVNAVVPTTIDTPANREAMPQADFAQWTPPARIAGVLRFLASDDAATVRGGLVPV